MAYFIQHHNTATNNSTSYVSFELLGFIIANSKTTLWWYSNQQSCFSLSLFYNNRKKYIIYFKLKIMLKTCSGVVLFSYLLSKSRKANSIFTILKKCQMFIQKYYFECFCLV